MTSKEHRTVQSLLIRVMRNQRMLAGMIAKLAVVSIPNGVADGVYAKTEICRAAEELSEAVKHSISELGE